MVRAISKRDYSKISEIHLASLSEDFLPSLGTGFLSTFYRGILGKDIVFGFVDERKKEISGFVIGTSDMASFFKSTIIFNFIPLSLHLSLALIKKPSIIKNILQTIFYTKKDAGPPAELVIIAVDEKYRGQGIGKKLIKALEKEMQKRKIKEYKLTVTKRNKSANRFYESIGFKKFDEFDLYGKSWNIITKSLK